MHVTKKLALGLGTAALSLALVGGIAAAAFTPVDAQAHDEKGKPPVAKLEEILEKLVLEGTLTVGQKDAIIARLKDTAAKIDEKRRTHEAKPRPERDEKKAQPRREEKKAQPKREEKKNEQRKEEQKTGVDVHRLLSSAHRLAATHLGLTEKALGEQLRSGKSLAEISGADAKPETTRETLIAAISAPAAARLAELKAAGKLTEAQAVAATAQLGSAAQRIVDAKRDIRKGDSPAKPKQP